MLSVTFKNLLFQVEDILALATQRGAKGDLVVLTAPLSPTQPTKHCVCA